MKRPSLSLSDLHIIVIHDREKKTERKKGRSREDVDVMYDYNAGGGKSDLGQAISDITVKNTLSRSPVTFRDHLNTYYLNI